MRKLRTNVGRVVRDFELSARQIANPRVQQFKESELELAKRVMAQEKTSKNKVYNVHTPVECISKGKGHKRYEFGVKVGVDVTNRSNFVVDGLSFPDNPDDVHTLATQLEQVKQITGTKPEEVSVDRGHRSHGVTESQVFISIQKRGLNTRLKFLPQRRKATEPMTRHIKNDCRIVPI